jgi:hypothetical protein
MLTILSADFDVYGTITVDACYRSSAGQPIRLSVRPLYDVTSRQ